MFGRLKNWLSGQQKPRSDRTVQCGKHGETEARFVCQHLARGGSSLGYFTDHDEPIVGWCSECNRVFEQYGGWGPEFAASASGKVVCVQCFEEIKDRNKFDPTT